MNHSQIENIFNIINGPNRHVLDHFKHFGLSPRNALRYADLRGVNFSGRDLSWIDFSFCKLEGAKFSQSDITGCIFENAIIDNSELRNANNFQLSLLDASGTLYYKFLRTQLVNCVSDFDHMIKSSIVIYVEKTQSIVMFSPQIAITMFTPEPRSDRFNKKNIDLLKSISRNYEADLLRRINYSYNQRDISSKALLSYFMHYKPVVVTLNTSGKELLDSILQYFNDHTLRISRIATVDTNPAS